MTPIEVVFSVESYDQVVEELAPMLETHWEELAVHKDIPLSPEWDFYRRASGSGLLIIYTARVVNELVGYSIFVLRKSHPHYSGHGWANNDIVWIRPDHRNVGIGKAFVEFWDADLASRGITVSHVSAKLTHPALIYLLQGCSYVSIEAGLEKRLDGYKRDLGPDTARPG